MPPPTPEGWPDDCPVCGKPVGTELSETGDGEPCSPCGHLELSSRDLGRTTLVVRLELGRAKRDLLSANQFRAEVIGRLCEHVSRANTVSR